MAINCWAVSTTGRHHAGLCHSTQGIARQLAGWLGAPYGEVSYRVAGIAASYRVLLDVACTLSGPKRDPKFCHVFRPIKASSQQLLNTMHSVNNRLLVRMERRRSSLP
jgi:hypothetical protein